MVCTLLPAMLYKPTSIWYNRDMNVTVGSYYNDEARGQQQEIHVSLDDSDGVEIFKDWGALSNNKKIEKLTALADIYTLQYAMTRGYVQEARTLDRIQNLINSYIK